MTIIYCIRTIRIKNVQLKTYNTKGFKCEINFELKALIDQRKKLVCRNGQQDIDRLDVFTSPPTGSY